jgi:anti-sigma factor RsiW
MTEESLRPDDDQLCGWLDSELDAAGHARVTAWLQQHGDDAARVRLWAADRDALRARLDAELAEPLPSDWAERVMAGPVSRASSPGWALPWEAIAAMLVLALGAGGAGGIWWARHSGPVPAEQQAGAGRPPAALAQAGEGSEPWLHFAALAHAVYVPEKRHPVEVAVDGVDSEAQRAQEEHLSRWLTKRLDVPVKLFDLQAQGYRLVGGRLLPESNGPCAMLMYQDAADQRVTVYLRRKGADVPAAFRYEQVGSLGLFYWVDGPAGYALVGSLPRERLLALAEAIHQQGGG